MKTYDARIPNTPLKSVSPGDFVIMDSGVYRVYDDGQRYRFYAADGEFVEHEAARDLELADYAATVDGCGYRAQ